MIKTLHFAVVLAALLSGTALAHDSSGGDEGAKVTLVYEHELPNVPGKSVKGVRRVRSGRLFGGPYTSSIRLHLRYRSRGRHPQPGQ